MKVGMAWMKDQSIKKKKKHLKPLMLICLQDSNITRNLLNHWYKQGLVKND